MKISVAGEEVTDEVAGNLEEVAKLRDGDSAPDASAIADGVLGLSKAETEDAFAGKHLELLRSRCYVDNNIMPVAGGIRRVFWRIMRPVFDWMSHKQNQVNAQLVHALELEKHVRDREVTELKKDIEALKKKA